MFQFATKCSFCQCECWTQKTVDIKTEGEKEKKKIWAGDKNMDACIPDQMNFIMPHSSVSFMYSTWLLRLWKLQNKN